MYTARQWIPTVATVKEEPMRFESLMWKVVVVFLVAGSVAWGTGTAPAIEDGDVFEAHDGGSEIPPPPRP
jgi:hypothetical protein